MKANNKEQLLISLVAEYNRNNPANQLNERELYEWAMDSLIKITQTFNVLGIDRPKWLVAVCDINDVDFCDEFEEYIISERK